jgi:ABC-2 type transport system ATP-binding protein
MESSIALEGVRKTFGDTVAVEGLDLHVPRGGLWGFIGPNGAGKTTSIRMIMSILFPDSGRISVLGHASALDAKDRIGYLPEERGVYKKMKVGAFLAYVARLKDADGAGLKQRIRGWLERVELPHVEYTRCEELSKGMQQKIQFIASVIHEPELLILDEPFSGLDPVNMRLLRDLVLAEHQRGATVIFSTHVMIQAEQLCDHIVMIDRGKKVLDDSLEAIKRQFDPRTLVCEPLDSAADMASVEALPEVASVIRDNGSWTISLVEGVAPTDALRAIAGTQDLVRIELQRPSLEDVFVEQVAAGSRSAKDLAELRASLRAEPQEVAS